MSDKLPVISGKDLVLLLEKKGFVIVRIKGSHHRMKHPDGRITTIPVHKNDQIIREDIVLSIEEFNDLIR